MSSNPPYKDLLVRSSVKDTGEVPFVGTASSSPDIIPAGTTPVNPQTFLANLEKDYGQNIYEAEDNYIYARGISLAPEQRSGKLHLYYSRASLLQYPSQWSGQEISLNDNTYGSTIEAAPGTYFVTAAPFFWRNVPTPPSGDHYCLVGRTVTSADPNPIPTIVEIENFAAWISANRGMSWRNIAVIRDPGAPTLSTDVFYEQGETAHTVYMQIVCKNVPTGCDVAFSCGTPGPNPIINLTRTKVTASGETLGIQTAIPKEFKSNITYSYWSNGIKLPEGAEFSLRAFYVPGENSPLRAIATDLREFGARPENLEQVGFGPTLGIHIGSFTLLTPAQ